MKGEAVYMDNCAVCHDTKAAGPKKVGPSMFGVGSGCKAATRPGLRLFGRPMKKSNLTWDNATLVGLSAGPGQEGFPALKWAFPASPIQATRPTSIAYLGHA